MIQERDNEAVIPKKATPNKPLGIWTPPTIINLHSTNTNAKAAATKETLIGFGTTAGPS